MSTSRSKLKKVFGSPQKEPAKIEVWVFKDTGSVFLKNYVERQAWDRYGVGYHMASNGACFASERYLGSLDEMLGQLQELVDKGEL